MTDDELDRRLRAVRPPTAADDGWSASPAGDDTLRDVLRSAHPRLGPAAALVAASRAAIGPRLRAVGGRPGTIGVALTAAAAVAAALTVGIAGDDGHGPTPQARRGPGPNLTSTPTGPTPATMSLVSYGSCSAALDGLRARAAANIAAYRATQYGTLYRLNASLPVATGSVARGDYATSKDAVDHSSTNNQESGVDEPDVVKTDGKRVVSVSGGVLRVTDVATRTTTGTLDLTMYAGAQDAQLLVDGDRALVVLGSDNGLERRYVPDFPSATSSAGTYLLVDLAPRDPKVVSTFRPRGAFVAARLVDGRVRVVVSSTPTLVAAQPKARTTAAQRLGVWRAAVARAPLTAWLPGWTITTGGVTTSGRVPCTALAHPAKYTGASLTTVYTVDLAGTGGFGDVRPTTLAADGSTVYASARSLYLTSAGAQCPAFASCAARSTGTEIHRFDITGAGAPDYLGSGSIKGDVLDAYSLSEDGGSLRVVTTVGSGRSSSTSVLALDADTLDVQGAVGGLGRGEQVYGVRFAGPLAYLVTFRRTDPLYVVDLSDPAKPVTSGKLKVTGFSDYLHLTGPGRLLGVGAEANRAGTPTGAQVSLFDVADPARPSRLDRVFRKDTDTSDVADPHAFQYWAPTRTAFVPLRDWNRADGRSQILVLRVGNDSLRTTGTITNPTVPSRDQYDSGIVRALVIGDSVWTMSSSGLQVSSLADLKRQAWIAFP